MRLRKLSAGTFPTPFQVETTAGLEALAAARSIGPLRFAREDAGANTFYRVEVACRGLVFSFEVYADVAYVETATDRWDSDAMGRNPPSEHERSLDFTCRVGRLLDGEKDWFTEADRSAADRLWEFIRRVGRLFR